MTLPKTHIIRDRASLIKCLYDIEEAEINNPLLEVTIREHKANRSAAQNSLLWWLHTHGGKHMGLDKNEMHDDIFKPRYVIPILMRDDPEYAAMVQAVRDVKTAGMEKKYEMLRKGIVRETSSTRLNVPQMAEALTEYERLLIKEGTMLPARPGDYELAVNGKKLS